ncbi:hypothetical protein PybrP1_008540 [[Pythium] brassicae (nom. inval.)]|nr:hypothetical protein PybrP1_008540 [[Pythium] brassicae (nom. inval.)]
MADHEQELGAEEIAARRSYALSLLKSKMERSRGACNRVHHHTTASSPSTESDRPESAVTEVEQVGTRSALGSATLDTISKSCPIDECRPANTANSSNNHDDEREEEVTIAKLKQRMATTVVLGVRARQTSASRRYKTNEAQDTHEIGGRASVIAVGTGHSSTPGRVGALMTSSSPPPPALPEIPSAEVLSRHDIAHSRALLKKLVVKWSCTTCKRECIPIREESSGHRYKEHPTSAADPRVKNKGAFRAFACASSKCACRAFFYVVAEGAWILRCRCKHKHVDHDPSSKPLGCIKPTCSCSAFDSPWMCNCDHPWAEHQQEVVEKEFRALELFQEQFRAQELSSVQRTDLVAESLAVAAAGGPVQPTSGRLKVEH